MKKVRRIKKYTIIFLIICSLFVACNQSYEPAETSFYYWRTTFQLSDIERQTLENNGVTKMYVRYFDVDLDSRGKPRPVSPIRFNQHPDNLRVVPVIYIKNKVMLQDNLQLRLMADNITDYISQINYQAGIVEYNEIQIDCDWTLKSRDRFMHFMDTLRNRSCRKLSATIRLHQVKHYSSTHIPNVDYATLMYYNMGEIEADTLNSIYDRKIAEQYIESLRNYPIRLNIALPIYAWGVHVREDNVINLVSKIDKTAFENDTNFIVLPNSNIIEVKHSNIKQGRYYLRNDWIKIEDVTEKELRQMGADIRKRLPYRPDEVIFFDLDEMNIKKYNNETGFFQKVAHHF